MQKKKRRVTINLANEENADWIKFANPLASLTEIYLHEVLGRCKNADERQASVHWNDIMGLSDSQKEELILKRLEEWHVQLPYWWEKSKSQKLRKDESKTDTDIET